MDIDLIISWVDSTDVNWQHSKALYTKKYGSINPCFFRNWGWLRFLFRSIEANLPWVRRIFFITCGQCPSWLNTSHEKLVCVNHKDYMPEDFLPTFSSHPIELNIHRIEGLSQQFIYMNDDMFFMNPLSPNDFFQEGRPCDCLWLQPLTEQFEDNFASIMLNNLLIVNKYQDLRTNAARLQDSLFHPSYPPKALEDNKLFQGLKHFPGFREFHMPIALLKSTLEELWSKEEMQLYTTCRHKIRATADVSIWLARDWQLAKMEFVPHYIPGMVLTNAGNPELDKIILSPKTNMLCINESETVPYSEELALKISSYFRKKFSHKSSFELYDDYK